MATILAVETSCDETSVAVVKDGAEVLSNIIASQIDLHQLYGGVVPEVASRAHMEAIGATLETALTEANVAWSDVDAVATTFGPGLQGALLVGLMAAKGAAWARGIPLVGVHHLAAHIWANKMAHPDLPLPFLCLLVSGGHTSLVRVDGPEQFTTLGETRDDAAGEAYDKTARLLGLGYPGGPVIDKLAKEGNPSAYDFPRAWLDGAPDFSFSGLKTAVSRLLEKSNAAGMPISIPDVCASFQRAVVDVLVTKTIQAAEREGIEAIAVAGGVAANRELRERLSAEAEKRGWRFVAPPMSLCTDNAAMIAGLGYELFKRGRLSGMDLGAISRLPLEKLGVAAKQG
ncbi:tRNA (adenosine(37)-N6)-threonylcarbamoyltransferase complex transferase subunit TsaD [bacterium]|nr:tRNA (adenosine(37)-N6)-threonylcarbamoyltransferase complex transferase subunit TsaD [bacterium]